MALHAFYTLSLLFICTQSYHKYGETLHDQEALSLEESILRVSEGKEGKLAPQHTSETIKVIPVAQDSPGAKHNIGVQKTLEPILQVKGTSIASRDEVLPKVTRAVAKEESIKPMIASQAIENIVEPMFNEPIAPVLVNASINRFSLANIPNLSSLDQTDNTVSSRPLYIGIHGSLKNMWILNQNTYGVFNGYEPRTQLDWGSAYGIHVGVKLNANTWLEVGANFNATQGQKYSDIVQGIELNREVDLVYHQFPFLVKKAHTLVLFNKSITGYWEGGIQYARLISAKQTVNTFSDIAIARRFKEHELSGIMGYSIDWPIYERMHINTGIQARLGSDINARGWASSDHYRMSHNVDVSLRIGINYLLTK